MAGPREVVEAVKWLFPASESCVTVLAMPVDGGRSQACALIL